MARNKTSIETRLIRSLGQALEIVQGSMAPARAYDLPLTARVANVPAAPAYDSTQIIAIRNKLKLSQALFAQALNVSPGTVRSWEQGEKPPQGPSRRLLEIAAKSPETILSAVVIRHPDTPREASMKKSRQSVGKSRSGRGERLEPRGKRRRRG